MQDDGNAEHHRAQTADVHTLANSLEMAWYFGDQQRLWGLNEKNNRSCAW